MQRETKQCKRQNRVSRLVNNFDRALLLLCCRIIASQIRCSLRMRCFISFLPINASSNPSCSQLGKHIRLAAVDGLKKGKGWSCGGELCFISITKGEVALSCSGFFGESIFMHFCRFVLVECIMGSVYFCLSVSHS